MPNRVAGRVLLLLAIAAAFAFGAQTQAFLVTDSPSYLDPARAWAQGRGLTEPSGVPLQGRLPAYPLVLGLVIRWLGEDLTAFTLLNVTLLVAGVLFVRQGLRLLLPDGGPWVDLVSAVSLLYPPVLTTTAFVLQETLIGCLLAAFFWAATAALLRPSTGRGLLAGLTLGLACLAKVTAAPLAIPLAAALARVPKPQARRALISLFGLAACLLPWAVRNQQLVGRFEFSNNNGGVAVLGGTVSNELDWNDFPEMREALVRWAAGEKMRHTIPDRFFYRVALERIRQDPWRWLRLVAGRALRFALPNRGYFAMVGATRTGTLGPFYLAGVVVQALLFGACLRVGWLVLRRRVALVWAVAPTIVLVHWAVYALSFATPRYNVSFGPLLWACLLLALWHAGRPSPTPKGGYD